MRSDVNDGFSEDVDRLRGALEASCVVGTWDWDHVRGVVTYDAGAARLLTGDAAFAEREISGRSAAAAVHPDDREWLAEHMRQAARAGGLVLSEYRVIAPDGAVNWLLSRGRTYRDHFDRPLRSRGILIDITEMRDGGARYVMGSAPQAGDPLERAADLAIALKETLGSDAPAELRAAADVLLFNLGRAIAQGWPSGRTTLVASSGLCGAQQGRAPSKKASRMLRLHPFRLREHDGGADCGPA